MAYYKLLLRYWKHMGIAERCAFAFLLFVASGESAILLNPVPHIVPSIWPLSAISLGVVLLGGYVYIAPFLGAMFINMAHISPIIHSDMLFTLVIAITSSIKLALVKYIFDRLFPNGVDCSQCKKILVLIILGSIPYIIEAFVVIGVVFLMNPGVPIDSYYASLTVMMVAQFLSIFLFTPSMMCFQKNIYKGTRCFLRVAPVVVIGFLILHSAYYIAMREEWQSINEDCKLRINSEVEQMISGFALYQEATKELQRHIVLSAGDRAPSFLPYAYYLMKEHPAFIKIAWCMQVTNPLRPWYEKKYHPIKDFDRESKSFIKAKIRPFYLPVTNIASEGKDEYERLGIDILNDPVIMYYVDRALSTGDVCVSREVKLYANNIVARRVVLPVYKKSILLGVIIASVATDSFLTLPLERLQSQGFGVNLYRLPMAQDKNQVKFLVAGGSYDPKASFTVTVPLKIGRTIFELYCSTSQYDNCLNYKSYILLCAFIVLFIFFSLTLQVLSYREFETMRKIKNDSKDSSRARQDLSIVLSSAGSGIVRIDNIGTVAFINPAAVTMLGYESSQELLDKPFHELLHPNNDFCPDPEHCPLECCMSNDFYQYNENGSFSPKLTRVVAATKQGNKIQLEFVFAHVPVCKDTKSNPQDEIQERPELEAVIALFIDVTDKVRIEKHKNELMATMSHELRTPARAISGALLLFDKTIPKDLLQQIPENSLKMLEIAKNNTKKLQNLVDDALALDALTAGKMVLHLVAVSASELLTRAVEDNLSLALNSRITLKIAGNVGQLKVDTLRVGQVLTNLIANAVKFSPKGADIVVGSELRGDKFVTFFVKDSGRGIPKNKIQSIFERFQVVDSSDVRDKGGTGLGLPISKGIVEAHGGTIWVVSKVGSGSTFYFTLPEFSEESKTQMDDQIEG